MLCDAFCPTHSAATSQRRAPAPRQRCIFPQNKQPQRQQAADEVGVAVRSPLTLHSSLRRGREAKGVVGNKGHALVSTTAASKQHAMTCMTASDDSTKRQAGSAQEILTTCVWCGLARCGRGAAWCGVGRQAASGVNGRASGMRMCDSANGSARRAGVCTYYYSFDYYIFILDNSGDDVRIRVVSRCSPRPVAVVCSR